MRAIWLSAMIFGYPVLELVNWTFLKLDPLFRPGLRKKTVQSPVFIIGNFRSGSTFLQRLLGRDTANFSSATTWEMMFAPSVLQRQMVKGFFIVDSWIGRPVRRWLDWLEPRVLKDSSAHKMGLRQPEEDEAFFLHNYSSSFLLFVQGRHELYQKYFQYDDMVASHRRDLDMDFYAEMVTRHMYAHGASSYYLSKSPSFTARTMSLFNRFPDARFIYLARHPLDVIPSTMKWFSEVWETMQKTGVRFPFKQFALDFIQDWYERVPRLLGEIPSEQIKIVYYDALVANPVETVQDIYQFLGTGISSEFSKILHREHSHAAAHWKPHKHSLELDGFQLRDLQEQFARVYESFGFKRLEEKEAKAAETETALKAGKGALLDV